MTFHQGSGHAARSEIGRARWGRRLLAVLAATQVSGIIFSPPCTAQLTPGEIVGKGDVGRLEGLVCEGIRWAVGHGMNLKIVPYGKIELPPAYVEATEKYSSQVSLGPKKELLGYVAGRPFAIVDRADPDAATKIMYNFERGHYFTDDLGMHLADAETGRIVLEGPTQRYEIERHFTLDWLRIIQYVGRTENEPIPAIADNPDGTFRKSGQYPLLDPFDLKGVGMLSYRYLNPDRQDDTWLYMPQVRRVRRLSSAQRSDALFGQDIDVDSYGGYAGQIPWFDWKLIGTEPMLGSLHGENLPPKPCTDDGGVTFCENWEMRPEVYILEGTPRLAAYAYSKRVIYVDKETYFILYSDVYDRGGELWKVIINNIRTSKQPNPKVSFSYPIERMFVYGFSAIDIQLLHATRAAIPGMAFPDEPGWLVNQGAKTGVGERWFTVAALIAAGR